MKIHKFLWCSALAWACLAARGANRPVIVTGGSPPVPPQHGQGRCPDDENEDEMRRRDSASVRVRAPSRGLVTRLPNELADQLADTDRRRVWVDAQNMRFEDGIAGNARGLFRTKRSGGLLTSLVHHWRFDEAAGDPGDSRYSLFSPIAWLDWDFSQGVPATPGKFGNAAKFQTGNQHALINDGVVGNLDMNGQSFTLTGWIQRSASVAAVSRVMGAGGSIGSLAGGAGYDSVINALVAMEVEYEISLNGSTLEFSVRDNSGVTHKCVNATVLNIGTWYFFSAVHTLGANISLRVNAVAGTPVTHTTGIKASQNGGIFSFSGAQTDGFVPFLLDSVSLWRGRALTSADVDALYNGGTGLDYPFAGGCANLIFQGNYIQSDPYPLFLGIGPNLDLGTKTFVPDPLEYGLTLTNIFTMPSGMADAAQRWSATDFFNKIVFAHKEITPRVYTTGTTTSVLPGLPDNDKFEGVTAFAQHLLLWKDTTLKWSGLNDLALWIPVAETIAALRLPIRDSFLQPIAGQNVTAYTTTMPTGIANGQFFRITDAGAAENYYSVITASPIGNTSATVIGGANQTVGASSTTRIFIAANTPWAAGQLVTLSGSTVPLSVASVSNYPTAAFPTQAAATVSSTNPRTVTVTLSAQLTDFAVGDYVSVGASASTGRDVWLVTAVTQNTTLVQLALEQVANAPNLGSNPTGNGATIPAGSNVIKQPWVRLTNSTGSTITATASTTISELYGLTLKLETLTGRVPGGTQAPTDLTRASNVVTVTFAAAHGYVVGNTITVADTTPSSFQGAFVIASVPSTTTLTYSQVGANESTTVDGTVQGTLPANSNLVSLDANEAGEAQIVGASDNGAIYQVVPLGDYAIILKNRVVQTVQYVGRLSGTFFIRTEIRDEGMVGRNAVTRLNDNRLVFLGNRELYDYRGGGSLVPVCLQYTRQLFEELDRSRIHEVTLHHKELRNEVWVIYPVKGGQKILVWNYVEDTASIDLYDNNLGGVCSVGQTRWTTDPTWNALADSMTWDSLADTVTWDSFVGSGEELVTLVATGDGAVFVHGINFNRDGVAYTSTGQTMDHDFGDQDAWKYIDVVVVHLQVKEGDIVNRKLYVEVGTKETTDGVITWSPRTTIFVQGAGQKPSKVNPGGSGRFVRLRFTSEDVDVQWRVSGYEIYARMGNTY